MAERDSETQAGQLGWPDEPVESTFGQWLGLINHGD